MIRKTRKIRKVKKIRKKRKINMISPSNLKQDFQNFNLLLMNLRFIFDV